jgi:predicted phage gp36 major capsid-like protein
MASLLADIAKAKTRAEKAEAALERAEEERARGEATRDDVSACREILIEDKKTLNLLLEEKKRLAVGQQVSERAVPLIQCCWRLRKVS